MSRRSRLRQLAATDERRDLGEPVPTRLPERRRELHGGTEPVHAEARIAAEAPREQVEHGERCLERDARDPPSSGPEQSGSTTSAAASIALPGTFVTATVADVPAWRSSAATVSAVVPEAEIPTASVPREGGVGVGLEACSAQAATPRLRSRAEAVSAAKRELPMPMKTTRSTGGIAGSCPSGVPAES